MASRRLTIYGNWSAYDELSDGVPLTEELAMWQFDEMLRLRAKGVRFDAYLMDAFWFDPDGGYRLWRKPNWPDGPQRWLDNCAEHGIIPGLWFTANTLCHLKPAAAWEDSVDANNWGMCCLHGGFLADYLDILDYWYERGIRIFKLDFADFSAAPPEVKATISSNEIRLRNVEAYRDALIGFRMTHRDAILMGFNGFESREYMDRTDRRTDQVINPAWLWAFDSIYSGDPRPADVPTVPFWRSVDIYGDHMTRVLERSGIPLSRIDNCGFMAGPTGTCYWRGKALWKGMMLLTLARGGNLTVLYGDLSQFEDEDARWMASAQCLFEEAFESGGAVSFGGIPGRAVPYGWLVGGKVCAVVNPRSTASTVSIPKGSWRLLFRDAGFEPVLDLAKRKVELAPYQMALLAIDGPYLGVQEDCVCQPREPQEFEVIESRASFLSVSTKPGNLRIIVRQSDAKAKLVKTFSGSESAAEAISIRALQGDRELDVFQHHDLVIWSGMSWGTADIVAPGSDPVRIEVRTTDQAIAAIELAIWK